MLLKKRQNAIKRDFNKGEKVYLKVTSGWYKGSILLLEKINEAPYWWEERPKQYRFLLNAPDLVRRLLVNPINLEETDKCETHLTNTPKTKKQKLPKDFVNTPIDIGDYLFGKKSLIKITTILENNMVEAKCIATINKEDEVDKITRYRSLKKFLKIEDPTQILKDIK